MRGLPRDWSSGSPHCSFRISWPGGALRAPRLVLRLLLRLWGYLGRPPPPRLVLATGSLLSLSIHWPRLWLPGLLIFVLFLTDFIALVVSSFIHLT